MDEAFCAAYNQILLEVVDATEKALNAARPHLKNRIEKDVYDHSVYTPKVYKRRSENAGLGTPLSVQAVTEANSKAIKPAISVAGNTFQVTSRLRFNPQGNHAIKKWHTADDNDLIGRIENKNPPYKWGQAQVPPRPFWKNFIDEMVGGGELEKLFVDAMKSAESTIKADGNITEDSSDRNY